MPQKILDGFLFLRFANVVLGTFFPPNMFPKSLSEAPVRSQKAHLGRPNTSILVGFRACLAVQGNSGLYNTLLHAMMCYGILKWVLRFSKCALGSVKLHA